jgi:predicted GIY-YIG superfamily endonuclease
MAFWVYILRCSDDSYYVGHTDDLEQRMVQHQSGELAAYTAKRLPVELVYSSELEGGADARRLGGAQAAGAGK